MNNYLFSNPFGTQIVKVGNVIRTSKNLRAMIDYARVSPVVKINTQHDCSNTYNGRLTVHYADGAHCDAFFSSFKVMLEWVENRRSWRRAEWVKA